MATLQLPQGKAPVRFTRAQIADMARGATVKVRTARKDPVVAMVARADRLLDRYYETCADAFGARHKLSKSDQGHLPEVYIPDALLNVEWSNGFAFTSIKQINRLFKGATARARQRLNDGERALARLRPGHGAGDIRLKLERRVSSERKVLKLFRLHREPMKAAFRKEQRRLLKVQNAVGLVAARRDYLASYRALQRVTKEIAAAKPKTADGALAIARYVEARLLCDRPQLFADDGGNPGNFGPLLRTALDFLARAKLQ